jgi:long-chain acyl-CoA synthetase
VRAKRHGIWVVRSWRDIAADVRAVARSMLAQGIGPGDVVAVVSENLPEVYVAEYAAHSVGAAVTCLYPDVSPSELRYVLGHSGARLLIAEDQEQVDKFLSLDADGAGKVERVIYIDRRGLWQGTDARLVAYADFAREGERDAAARDGELQRRIEGASDTDIAALCYTSGTTGAPKGVVLTHRYMLDNAYRLLASFAIPAGIDYLSYISPAWAAEQITGLGLALLAPMVVHFAEKPETVQHDLREIGAQFLLFTPRQWEMMASAVEAQMQDAGPLRRRLFEWALRSRGTGAAAPPLRSWAAERLMLRALRDNLGLKRAIVALSAGSGLSAEVFRRFHALGVPLRNLYGSTEFGLVSAHWGGSFDPATMGRLLQVDRTLGTPLEAVLAGSGELELAGGSGFGGYYHDAAATQAVLTAEGRFRTGDAIRVDASGDLVFLDRVRDLRRLRTGHVFPPQFIENRLRASPYIRDAIVIGDERRDFVTALVNVDAAIVGRYAETRGLAWSTYADLSQLPDVHALVRDALNRINAELDVGARVRRFATFPKELDPDDSELTRSRKLRRDVIEERYKPIIDALYGGAGECVLAVKVQYRDGGTATIDARVRATDVGEMGARR